MDLDDLLFRQQAAQDDAAIDDRRALVALGGIVSMRPIHAGAPWGDPQGALAQLLRGEAEDLRGEIRVGGARRRRRGRRDRRPRRLGRRPPRHRPRRALSGSQRADGVEDPRAAEPGTARSHVAERPQDVVSEQPLDGPDRDLHVGGGGQLEYDVHDLAVAEAAAPGDPVADDTVDPLLERSLRPPRGAPAHSEQSLDAVPETQSPLALSSSRRPTARLRTWDRVRSPRAQGYLCEGDPWVVVVKTHRYPCAQKNIGRGDAWGSNVRRGGTPQHERARVDGPPSRAESMEGSRRRRGFGDPAEVELHRQQVAARAAAQPILEEVAALAFRAGVGAVGVRIPSQGVFSAVAVIMRRPPGSTSSRVILTFFSRWMRWPCSSSGCSGPITASESAHRHHRAIAITVGRRSRRSPDPAWPAGAAIPGRRPASRSRPR